MKIYIKDFDKNGTRECVTSMYKSDHVEYTFNMRQDLVGQMPLFKKRFLRYENYAGKPFKEVFTEEMLNQAEVHEVNNLASAVFVNNGKGRFNCKPFPFRAQLSCINTILCDDIGGKKTMLMGGNFYGFKPEIGRLDASYGLCYQYNKNGFKYMEPAKSGIKLSGQVRSSLIIKNNKGGKYYLFGINDEQLKAFQLNN